MGSKPVDLKEKHFGRLIALYPTDKRTKDRSVIWHCKCDCGNEIDVPSKSLKSGNTKSCGCLNDEKRKITGKNNKKDLTNMVFEKIKVIKDSGERSSNTILWECQCLECGSLFKTTGYRLKHGIQSCGCIKSKGEQKISQILNENNIPFEIHKTFNNCLFENGYHAYFDFYIDNKYLIEYDGEQHFFAKETGWNNEENLKRTQERDNFKSKWCKENNIPLIRIPYTKLATLSIQDLLLKN